jgi:hypothetical protein
VPDDDVDDTTAVVAALRRAAGAALVLPRGVYRLRADCRLRVAANTLVEGAPGTVLLLASGAHVPVFDVDGQSGVTLRKLAVRPAPGAVVGGGCYGVLVRGAARDVLIEDFTGDGLVEAVHVGGSMGAKPGIARRITLRRVRATSSPSLWGIGLDDCDGVTLDACYAAGNWLDGIKLRKNTLNVDILNCTSEDNGRGDKNGDGIDVYAGGYQFRVIGGTYRANRGCGIQMKTGALNRAGEADGHRAAVGRAQIIDAKFVDNRNTGGGGGGHGIVITVNEFGDGTLPVPDGVLIRNCLFAGNAGHGLYIAAGHDVHVVGSTASANAASGFVTGTRASDVTFTDCRSLANSREGAGKHDGVVFNGSTAVRWAGGAVIGMDVDEAGNKPGDDDDDRVVYHRRGIYVSRSSKDVDIAGDPDVRHHTDPRGIVVDGRPPPP